VPERNPRRSGQPAKRGGQPAKRSASSAYKRAGGTAKKRTTARGNPKQRTSRNTDDKNPSRSGIDYPSKKYRSKEGEPAEPSRKPSLRKKQTSRDEKPSPKKSRAPKKIQAPHHRRRRVKTTEASEELAKLAGRDARKAQEILARGAEAYSAGRERDAMRLLRPLRDAYPDASAVRELFGLCHYRIGQYPAAAKELEAFAELTNSVEQHPVLMDCYRAQGKWRRVEELWEELRVSSPSSSLVTEGRIVLAGSRADRGRINEAIATLARGAGVPNRVREQHLRLWYALADLYERAGDVPAARELFLRVRKNDGAFADVAERLATLG
jgi:tetratricopeptide (TPR) repeat protein